METQQDETEMQNNEEEDVNQQLPEMKGISEESNVSEV